jgi:hypothetical protein
VPSINRLILRDRLRAFRQGRHRCPDERQSSRDDLIRFIVHFFLRVALQKS